MPANRNELSLVFAAALDNSCYSCAVELPGSAGTFVAKELIQC